MLTVKQIVGKSEIEIKRMSLSERIKFQDKLVDDNNHTGVILVDAVVQSHQTVIEGLSFIVTLASEIGFMTQPMLDLRQQLSKYLTHPTAHV